jgi:hypothetical protein
MLVVVVVLMAAASDHSARCQDGLYRIMFMTVFY